MKLKNILGINVKYYRFQKGYTQEALAEKIDVSSKYIGRLERGRYSPSLDTIELLCQILDIEPYLLFKENTNHQNLPSRVNLK